MRKFLALIILLSLAFLAFSNSQSDNFKNLSASKVFLNKDIIINSDVLIKFFTAHKKVIPLYYNLDNKFWITNIKLPDLVVTNKSENKLNFNRVVIIGKNNETELVRFKLNKNDMQELVERINRTVNYLIKNNELYRLKPIFGKMYIPSGCFANEFILNPSESICIPLSRIVFIHYIGKSKINQLEINFTIESNSEEKVVEFPIKLTPYRCKGKYILPLKGTLCLIQHPMIFTVHRLALSQEFAIDILDQRLTQNGKFTTSSTPNPTKLSDFFIFQRNIMAIGDGTVVEVGDSFPESKMSEPSSYSEKYFKELRKELVPKIGFKNFTCGNYIVIDHYNGEFSFYGHLSEGSIKVEVGEKVNKGDIIAKVGNTGHSTEPHLHFHLMDSKNILEANGLPVMFENVALDALGYNVTEANSLMNTEFLYIEFSNQKKKK